MDLTGIVVEYCTSDLLDEAIGSIRRFYDFKIIVINGGEPVELDYPNVEVVDLGYNIGHGLGMDMGIKMAETDYVLTFDTDIIMHKPCIEEMMGKIKEETYSIGKVYLINNGKFYHDNRDIFPNSIVARMTHPSFQIVSKKEYLKYAPYISDGAPTVLSYHDLMRWKRQKTLVDFPILDYVEHRNAGTRDRITNPEYISSGHIHWLDKWKIYIKEHPLEVV